MATIRDEIDSMSMWPKVPQRKTGLTKKSAIEKWGFPALIAAAAIADLTGDNRKFRNEAIPKALTLLGTNLVGQQMGKRRQTDTMAEADFQNQWLQYQDVINRMEFGAQERAEQAKQQRLNRGDELDMKKWMLQNWQPPEPPKLSNQAEQVRDLMDMGYTKDDAVDRVYKTGKYATGGKSGDNETPEADMIAEAHKQYMGLIKNWDEKKDGEPPSFMEFMNQETIPSFVPKPKKIVVGGVPGEDANYDHAQKFKKAGLSVNDIEWDEFLKDNPQADTTAIKRYLK